MEINKEYMPNYSFELAPIIYTKDAFPEEEYNSMNDIYCTFSEISTWCFNKWVMPNDIKAKISNESIKNENIGEIINDCGLDLYCQEKPYELQDMIKATDDGIVLVSLNHSSVLGDKKKYLLITLLKH